MTRSRGKWQKSSYSQQGACLEVRTRGGISIRDSKLSRGAFVTCSIPAWAIFVEFVRSSVSPSR
ncbi:DUF397 domain-containing protein [Streptomyces sp. NPDC018972]|uniref:DUF397 domain-containing protein n=1 Tax=Streptomyces sp. NPDC018972 TaxID=3365060 RepID=UPI003796FD09